jgi:hypothetical protein
LPPVGTCSAYANNLDLNQVLSAGINLSKDSGGLLNGELDAGPALSIMGPGGNSIAAPRVDDDQTIGPYVGLLGGQIPLDGMPVSPLFLNGGGYTITGAGGKDVGPFAANVTLPLPAKWTNRDQINTVDRSAGVTLTWTGGDPTSDLVVIAGGSVNQITNAAAGFFCSAPLAAGTFTVPASVLANLPVNSAGTPEDTVGLLLVGTVPGGGFSTFSAKGLDSGLVLYGTLDIKTVTIQ